MQVLTEGTLTDVIEGIPSDAEFRGFCHNHHENTMDIFVEHPFYDESPVGESFPRGDIKLNWRPGEN